MKIKKPGGYVLMHKLFSPKYNDPNDDFWEVLNTAIARAKQGHKTEVLPQIHAKDLAARAKILIALDNQTSNPDLRDILTGLFYDVKSVENVENIVKNANKASAQGATVIITDFRTKISEEDIEIFTARIFGDENYIQNEIVFFINGRFEIKKRQ